MIANPEFQNQPKYFWAYVRTLSQHLGYTVRSKGIVKVPTLSEMRRGLRDLGLDFQKVVVGFELTQLGEELDAYFHYRSKVLNDSVQHYLMVAEEARKTFEEMQRSQPQAVM